MLHRSRNSEEAALFLLSKRKYEGCVVAFYYSILQRIMYSLNEHERRPLPYELQNPLNEDIHNKILNEIKNRFPNRKEGDAFKEYFVRLFDFRKRADYQIDIINQDECLVCRSIHERLMGQLNRFFPVKDN